MRTTWIKCCAGVAAAGVLWLGGSGCSRNGDATRVDEHAGHGHEGEAEVKVAQITVFGERHEVFAEHALAVAGTPTKFVTHVTDLKTLQPRREGPVRFVMRQGQEPPVEKVEKAPSRAGIYEAVLTFPKAGEWNVTLMVPGEGGEARVAFPPVKVYADAHEAEHAEVPEPPEGISFLKEQQWKVSAGTEAVAKRKLVEQLRLPAVVKARPGALAQVTAPVAGRLVLPSGGRMPVVGDKVEAGQVLALVQPSFSEVAARLAEAESEVVRSGLAREQAELALKRVEELAKAEAKSGRELQEAQFAWKAARARHEAALGLQASYRQASTNLAGLDGGPTQAAIELRSPIAGVITGQSGAAVGEHVGAEKAVFTVLEAGTVFIEAGVPEASVKRLGKLKAASYAEPGESGQLSPITVEGTGRLVYVGLQVDAATRTVPLVYEVRNPAGALRVGQALDLYVETDRVEAGLAIPSGAIVEEGGRPIAFVQVAGETFQKRDLALGIRDGDWVQVTSGLSEGERVVTQGAYAVRLASVSSSIPAHGHAH